MEHPNTLYSQTGKRRGDFPIRAPPSGLSGGSKHRATMWVEGTLNLGMNPSGRQISLELKS